MAEASAELDCPVVGGDLSVGPAVVASVTVAGFLPEDGHPPLLRSGAEPGDTLLVTGSLGASAAGLRLLRTADEGATSTTAPAPDVVPAVLAAAYLRPRAQVAEGVAARGGGANAAIDLSDGLASDARRLADASRVGMVIDVVPVARRRDRGRGGRRGRGLRPVGGRARAGAAARRLFGVGIGRATRHRPVHR